MKRIEGRARTVRELLDSTKYTVDFYQREFSRNTTQLIVPIFYRFRGLGNKKINDEAPP